MTNIKRSITTTVQSDSKVWLASPHGTEPNAMPSITVDTSLFGAPAKTDGYIKSGTLITETGVGTGVYGPYNAAAAAGIRHLILFQAIDTSHGDQRFGTAGLVHGFVFGAKLPGGSPSAADKAKFPLIYFY